MFKKLRERRNKAKARRQQIKNAVEKLSPEVRLLVEEKNEPVLAPYLGFGLALFFFIFMSSISLISINTTIHAIDNIAGENFFENISIGSGNADALNSIVPILFVVSTVYIIFILFAHAWEVYRHEKKTRKMGREILKEYDNR